MSKKSISLAILSDLHCQQSKHPLDTNYSDDSYLKTDLLRDSMDDHPVESLIQLIKKDEIKQVDFTLCPGDFTNKSDRQGFISGWGFSLEIHREIGSSDIMATLGNHDVDSYGSSSSYSMEIAKGIKRGFPLNNDDLCDTFWAKGCAFVEKDDCRFLIINSSHFHHNKSESGSGRVDGGLIQYVKEYLAQNKDDKIKIAMAHHHPIDHSRLKLGEEDKIINADQLLTVLGDNSFDLFIHGHKHDPLLRYHPCTNTNYKIPILSSGSFSATSNFSWTSRRNAFHRLEISKDSDGSSTCQIKTWTFMPRSGWVLNYDDSGFDPITGFGYTGTLLELVDKIRNFVGKEILKKWENVVEEIPEVQFLIPDEAKEFERLLHDSGYLLSRRISQTPEYITNTNKH